MVDIKFHKQRDFLVSRSSSGDKFGQPNFSGESKLGSKEYLREFIISGRIKACKEGRRGNYRISRDEIDKYIKRKHNEEIRIHPPKEV